MAATQVRDWFIVITVINRIRNPRLWARHIVSDGLHTSEERK